MINNVQEAAFSSETSPDDNLVLMSVSAIQKDRNANLRSYMVPAVKTDGFTGVSFISRPQYKGLQPAEHSFLLYELEGCLEGFAESQSMATGLYSWRDKTAREKDESVEFVLSRQQMLNLAVALPKTAKDLKKASGWVRIIDVLLHHGWYANIASLCRANYYGSQMCCNAGGTLTSGSICSQDSPHMSLCRLELSIFAAVAI